MAPTGSTFSTRFQSKFISWIDYGQPDPTQRDDVPAKINLQPDFFWSTTSGGVRFGEQKQNSYSFAFDPNQSLTGTSDVYTIFDSASTELLISELWYESFITNYFET